MERGTMRDGVAILLAGALLTAPAMAQTLPPFEGGPDRNGQDTWRFTPDATGHDFALQAGYLLPRAPALMQSTQQAARVGLAGWRGRHVDLRDARAGSSEGGIWMRLHGEFGGREQRLGELYIRTDDGTANIGDLLDGLNFLALLKDMLVHDHDIDAELIQAAIEGTFNLDHDHSFYGFNVGFDVIRGSDGDSAWLLGATAGYVRSRTDFDDFDAVGLGSRFDGDTMNLGFYGSFVSGGRYVDAALSYAWHSHDVDLPGMDLRPEGAVLSSNARTLAIQVDAGWRIPLLSGWGLYIEPVGGMTWVRADIDDTNIQPADSRVLGSQGNRLAFGRQESLRGHLGLQVGTEWILSDGLGLSGVLGLRQWRDFERHANAALDLRGERLDLTIPNSEPRAGFHRSVEIRSELVRSLTEISADMAVYSADNHFSSALSVGYLAESDYESWGITASFRYQW